MNKNSTQDQIELMRKSIEEEKEKRGYAITEPIGEVSLKSGSGRVALAIIGAFLFFVVFAAAVMVLSALNAGLPISFFGFEI